MNHTGDALVHAILEEPGDDALRLIYADWLQDHDQPDRAEFIRVQMAMDKTLCAAEPVEGEPARSPYSMYCTDLACRHCELDRRAESLCTNASWLPACAFLKAPGLVKYIWRRGFLYEIEAPFAFLTEHLPQLVREQPVQLADPNDRAPGKDTGSDDPWRWSRGVSGRSDIGDAWNHLPGSYEVIGLVTRQVARLHDGFATEEEARVGASLALVAWAKSIKCLVCNDTRMVKQDADDLSLCTKKDCPACTFKGDIIAKRWFMDVGKPVPLDPRGFVGGTS